MDTPSRVLLNISQLRAKLGDRSRTSIYRDVAEGRLPKPLHIGKRPYWDDAQVDKKIDDAIADASQPEAK